MGDGLPNRIVGKAFCLRSLLGCRGPGHRWIRYAGTGKNVFGNSQSFGHASPAGAVFLDNDVLSAWMKGRSRAEILELYSFLQTAPHDVSLDRGYEIMQYARAQGK
jgi:hypothetical protein